MNLIDLAVRYRVNLLIPVFVVFVLALLNMCDESAVVPFGLNISVRVVRRDSNALES